MVKSQMCAVTKISYQLLSSSLPRAINLDIYIKSQDMEKSSAKWVIINLAVFYIYISKKQHKVKGKNNYLHWQNIYSKDK